MLSHEWQELSELSERISTMRERYQAAVQSNNVGLLFGLKADLSTATRQREELVKHISARFGSVAA